MMFERKYLEEKYRILNITKTKHKKQKHEKMFIFVPNIHTNIFKGKYKHQKYFQKKNNLRKR